MRLLLAVVLCVSVAGCRSSLDLRTAQTAHVVRIQATKFADAYTGRAVAAEEGQFARDLDESIADLKAGKVTPDELKADILAATQNRDAQMSRIRTDREDFAWYMDLLGDLERGYTGLFNQQQQLRSMFTGEAAKPAEMPATSKGGAQ